MIFYYMFSIVSSTAFSIGFRFYYWPKYKDMEVLQTNLGVQGILNDLDHSGYKPKDLYIYKKYQSLKEEILNYKHIKIKNYESQIIPKAKSYCNTNWVKSIGCYMDRFGRTPLHYEIVGHEFTLSHIISVILYCDYSKLSADFSSTFRQINTFETFENIKRRNSSYFWMSKLLRETVVLVMKMIWICWTIL